MALFVASGCSALRDDRAAETRTQTGTIRFVLAFTQPRDGYAPMIDTSGRTIYVGDAAEINENDVESARAYHGDGPSFVEITLKPVAAERFLYLTRGHVGQPLAIFVNGQLVSAPVVQDVITNARAYVSGKMTAEEADALAASIGNR